MEGHWSFVIWLLVIGTVGINSKKHDQISEDIERNKINQIIEDPNDFIRKPIGVIDDVNREGPKIADRYSDALGVVHHSSNGIRSKRNVMKHYKPSRDVRISEAERHLTEMNTNMNQLRIQLMRIRPNYVPDPDTVENVIENGEQIVLAEHNRLMQAQRNH